MALIVVKTPREPGCERFAHEVEIYDILESRQRLCPDVVRSFLRSLDCNFLFFCRGGSLESRLREHQVRNDEPHGGRLVKVTQLESVDLVERWVMELTSAAAWLESAGLAHNDIRPPNLLLDIDDHLKLADFDSVAQIGSVAQGGAPPWARVLGVEAGIKAGTFGENGARVEQFAIGSVLYLMTRGHEPYDDGAFGPDDGRVIVQLLKNMVFPKLTNSNVDKIISRCWHGEYKQLEDLADMARSLEGAIKLPRASVMNEDVYAKMREKCVYIKCNASS